MLECICGRMIAELQTNSNRKSVRANPSAYPRHPPHPSDSGFSGVAQHEGGMSVAEPLAIFPGTEYIKR